MFPSFEGFKSWVANQSGSMTYNYFDNDDCAFARYLKSLGFTNVKVDGFDYRYLDRAGNPRNEALDSLHPDFGTLLALAVSGRIDALHAILMDA